MMSVASFQGRIRALARTVTIVGAIGGGWSAFAAAPATTVASVQSTRVADLVLLSNGFNAGLRQGMLCRVTRGTTDIAEILLVDLRPTCSSALIVNVAPKRSIRAGDVATIKVLKT